jgi:hypothetical protein
LTDRRAARTIIGATCEFVRSAVAAVDTKMPVDTQTFVDAQTLLVAKDVPPYSCMTSMREVPGFQKY